MKVFNFSPPIRHSLLIDDADDGESCYCFHMDLIPQSLQPHLLPRTSNIGPRSSNPGSQDLGTRNPDSGLCCYPTYLLEHPISNHGPRTLGLCSSRNCFLKHPTPNPRTQSLISTTTPSASSNIQSRTLEHGLGTLVSAAPLTRRDLGPRSGVRDWFFEEKGGRKDWGPWSTWKQ